MDARQKAVSAGAGGAPPKPKRTRKRGAAAADAIDDVTPTPLFDHSKRPRKLVGKGTQPFHVLPLLVSRELIICLYLQNLFVVVVAKRLGATPLTFVSNASFQSSPRSVAFTSTTTA